MLHRDEARLIWIRKPEHEHEPPRPTGVSMKKEVIYSGSDQDYDFTDKKIRSESV